MNQVLNYFLLELKKQSTVHMRCCCLQSWWLRFKPGIQRSKQPRGFDYSTSMAKLTIIETEYMNLKKNDSTVITEHCWKWWKYPIHLVMLRLLGEFPRCLQAALLPPTERPLTSMPFGDGSDSAERIAFHHPNHLDLLQVVGENKKNVPQMVIWWWFIMLQCKKSS